MNDFLVTSGIKKMVDDEVAKRQKSQREPGKLLKVTKVVKHPRRHPPRTIATIHLEDGTTHELIEEDALGKRNYELSTCVSFEGDVLYCKCPVPPAEKLILVGSEESTKRL